MKPNLMIVILMIAVLFLVVAVFFPVDTSPHSERIATFKVTAYCLKGRTATGTYVRPGTVAVDPRVIPLRRKLFVSGYGHGVALDTGSAIKGYRADVWMASCSAARQWGVRYVKVRW